MNSTTDGKSRGWLHPRRLIAAGVLLVIAITLVRLALWRPLTCSGAAPTDGFTRLAGAVHVHTTYSDGGGSAQEVIAAAQSLGLDFVIITDHNNADAKPLEGYHGRLLVMVGSEVSTRTGHVLGLGIARPTFCFSGDAADALDDIHFLGGQPIVAHPMRSGSEPPWSRWDLPGPWGLELFNGKAQLSEAPLWRWARMLAAYPVNPRWAMLSMATPPTDVLRRWDAILATRPAAGTAGSDAHNRIGRRERTWVRFPSYAAQIGLSLNHVVLKSPLMGDAAADARAIVAALAHGSSYIGLDGLAPANEISFTARTRTSQWTMGEVVPAEPAPRLTFAGRMPQGTRVVLLRDGVALAQGVGRLETGPVGPGIYRVEARVPGWETPWILTNPISVLSAEQALTRAERAAWPAPTPAPPAKIVLDTFNGPSHFNLEFDPSSSTESPAIDPHGGADRRGAARLRFRLGVPGPGRPYTWCALVERQARDLSGTQGLVFSIKADGAYRVWVQVRDANPASTDDGTEWWFASVRTATEWQRVAVPYGRLFSLNTHSDGRLDLDRVRALVFVLDHKAVPPGTSGTIWIDDLGAY